MKKVIVTIITMSLLACNKEKGSADTEYVRKEFIENCVEGAKEQMIIQGADINIEDIESFCHCSADKALAELSQEELVKLGAENQEIMHKTQELTKPCLEEFLRKISDQLIKQIQEIE